ncbi:hemerythrin domain-containing protein [Sulfodiicoccus acidiphilus]|nr:hemerythrin domain-containing protein [Sulfodiicoccus acidiphilus]
MRDVDENKVSSVMISDHAEEEDLLIQVEEAVERGEDALPKFEILEANLKRHIYAEEEILFPRIEDGSWRPVVEELMNQHCAIWDGLREFKSNVGTSEAPKVLNRLYSLLKVHNSIEEGGVYGAVDDSMTTPLDLERVEVPLGWEPLFTINGAGLRSRRY